MIIAT
jgi:hypothetical protein